MSYSKFEDLNGHILIDVILDEKYQTVEFITKSGLSFSMYHEQDCCESVKIKKLKGDFSKLLGSKIVEASSEVESSFYSKEDEECGTLSTFKLKTSNGKKITLEWVGISNGYYGEGVSFFDGKKYTPEEVKSIMEKNKISNVQIEEEFLNKINDKIKKKNKVKKNA